MPDDIDIIDATASGEPPEASRVEPCATDRMETGVTSFATNVHGANDSAQLSSSVQSVVLKQQGQELKVANTTAPIRIRIPLPGSGQQATRLSNAERQTLLSLPTRRVCDRPPRQRTSKARLVVMG